MNYEKTYPVPATTARVVRLPVSRLRAGDTIGEFSLLHVREGARGFECAEGLKSAGYPRQPSGAMSDVFATCDEIFVLYADGQGEKHLYGLECSRDYSDMPAGDVRCIVPVAPVVDYALPHTWYVVTASNTWRCCAYEASKDFSEGLGGLYGAEYAGRFFLLTRRRLYYTGPYDESPWTYTENGDMQAFGYLEIPPRCGAFVGGACFGDKLYLFARAGLMEVEMGGKTLNGKTRYLPHGVGETVDGSIVAIGDRAYFFTERGLCTFDGENFRRLDTPGVRGIDFSAGCSAGTWRGRYYAFVTLAEGDKRVYVYDPLTERETFLLIAADRFCAGLKAVALKGGVLYELGDGVLPANGDPCSIRFKLTVNGGKLARIDWVRIEGEGRFEVQAATPEDGAARATGKAEEELQLSRSLFGATLSLDISTRDAKFLVTGIEIGMGEGTDGD